MKSKCLLFLLVLISSIGGVFAQSQRTFESMGYDDASIVGITGSLSYFLKVKPDDNVDQSKIIINIRASQVLNPNNSVVVIYLKDEPVFTQRIIASAVDTMFTVSVPMNRKYLQPDGRFIKLKVSAKMSIGDEYCKDVDNPACWIAVKNSSYLALNISGPLSYKRSIKEWIQEFNSLYTPVTADLDDLTAGGILYTLLKQNSPLPIRTETYQPQDTVPSGIIIGLADKLPYSVKQAIPSIPQGYGLIMMARVNVGFTSKLVLVVTGSDQTGYRKAINTLASNKRISGAFSDRMLISEGVPSNVSIDNPSPLITALEDIGGNPALMEGIGGLRQKYNFSLSEFNAFPINLLFI